MILEYFFFITLVLVNQKIFTNLKLLKTKKLLFTAIAIVTLGTSINAKTKDFVDESVDFTSTCSDVAYIAATVMEEYSENVSVECLSSREYNAIYMEAYNDCMR